MGQDLYWHAPLIEVLLVVLTSLAVLGWLVARALGRPEVGKALATLDPALARHPLFLFDAVRGVTALNEAAERLLGDPQSQGGGTADNPLVETILQAYEGAQTAQREGWPTAGQTLIAVPIAAQSDAVTGVLAVVAADDLAPPVVRSRDDPGVTDAATWHSLGPTLRFHRTRPVVLVSRFTGAPGRAVSSAWEEAQLTHTEERLLRHMLVHQGDVQPAETLFGLIWPADEVDSLGLRPDQRDRLRRLVFQLRQQVEPDPGSPRYVCTAHGVGYVLYREPEPAEG